MIADAEQQVWGIGGAQAFGFRWTNVFGNVEKLS